MAKRKGFNEHTPKEKRFKALNNSDTDLNINRFLEIESNIRSDDFFIESYRNGPAHHEKVHIPVDMGFIGEPFPSICSFGSLRLFAEIIKREKASRRFPTPTSKDDPEYKKNIIESIQPVHLGRQKFALKNEATLIICGHDMLGFVRACLKAHVPDLVVFPPEGDHKSRSRIKIDHTFYCSDVVLLCDDAFTCHSKKTSCDRYLKDRKFFKCDPKHLDDNGHILYHIKNDWVKSASSISPLMTVVKTVFNRVIAYHLDNFPLYEEPFETSTYLVPTWLVLDTKPDGPYAFDLMYECFGDMWMGRQIYDPVNTPGLADLLIQLKKPPLEYHISYDAKLRYSPMKHELAMMDFSYPHDFQSPSPIAYSKNNTTERKLILDSKPLSAVIEIMRTSSRYYRADTEALLPSIEYIKENKPLCMRMQSELVQLTISILELIVLESDIATLDRYISDYRTKHPKNYFYQLSTNNPTEQLEKEFYAFESQLISKTTITYYQYVLFSGLKKFMYMRCYKQLDKNPGLMDMFVKLTQVEYQLKVTLLNLSDHCDLIGTAYSDFMTSFSMTFDVGEILLENLLTNDFDLPEDYLIAKIYDLIRSRDMDYDALLQILHHNPNCRLLCAVCQTPIEYIGTILHCGHMFCPKHRSITDTYLEKCKTCSYLSESFVFCTDSSKSGDMLPINVYLENWPPFLGNYSECVSVLPKIDVINYGSRLALLRNYLPRFVGKNLLIITHHYQILSKNNHVEDSLTLSPYVDFIWSYDIPYYERVIGFTTSPQNNSKVTIMTVNPEEIHLNLIIENVDVIVFFTNMSEHITHHVLSHVKPKYGSDLVVLNIGWDFSEHILDTPATVEIASACYRSKLARISNRKNRQKPTTIAYCRDAYEKKHVFQEITKSYNSDRFCDWHL